MESLISVTWFPASSYQPRNSYPVLDGVVRLITDSTVYTSGLSSAFPSRYVIEYDEQIHILAGSDNAMEAARLDCEIAEAIMDNLRRCDYDLILVDNCNTLKDTTVISLDTSTVQDARNFLDVLSEFRIDKSNIRMVINQVPLDDKKCELGISHVARILTMEPTCIIHTNQDARSFANVGEAASSDKGSLFSKEIRTLARAAVAVDEELEKPEKCSGGFLRRLFGRKR